VFPISAPLEEGMEPLLDSIIQRLADPVVNEAVEASDERPWSPL
jgi:GTP-binding protein